MEYTYDSKIWSWLSVDPLAEKQPDVSPYAYVNNNPVRYIDPDGRFLFDVHNRILTNAINMMKTSFSKDILAGMGYNNKIYRGGIVFPDLRGVGPFSGKYDKHDHFDSMNKDQIATNFNRIGSEANMLIKQFKSGLISENDFGFGIGEQVHAIQDFYSHSNFVELFEEAGGDINGFIPTYEEVMNGNNYSKLKDLINSGRLFTGEYDEENHKRGPGSHQVMNKDQGKGSSLNFRGFLSEFLIEDAHNKAPTPQSRAAERAAERATFQFLRRVRDDL
ncbi:MAG: hypothetical protein C4K58_02170 [Flavobacteriaceae bacterium]|nr:MAG: hypothetical protein C4K58_02170 [Flavobacteriaceae bacterium]